MEQGRYSHPKVAIIDPNTPAALGLKAMLQELIPVMDVCTFGSVGELAANKPESFFHYFVALNVLLENRAFFTERRSKTIVLTPSAAEEAQPQGFHSICTYVPERQLVRSLLALEQGARAGGRNLPPVVGTHRRVLSGAFEVSLLLFQSYLFLMLLMSFMMEYSRILFDGNDNHILQRLPVNSKTILVARLVSMLVYMFFSFRLYVGDPDGDNRLLERV